MSMALPVHHYDPSEEALTETDQASGPSIIVIGSGPVGMRVVSEIYARLPHAQVKVFSNEPFEPYNRVQLSALLAGEVSRKDIEISLPDTSKYLGFSFTVAAISKIDRAHKVVTDSLGYQYDYDHLVIATGARAHIPNIPGLDNTGVYTFRNLATRSISIHVLLELDM